MATLMSRHGTCVQSLMADAFAPPSPDTSLLRDIKSQLTDRLEATLAQRNLALLAVSAMVRDLQALVHALQRERGSTNLQLSAQHHLYVELMTEFRQESDRARSSVLVSLSQLLPQTHASAMGYGFLDKVALALQAQELLAPLRADVDAARITRDQAVVSYSHIIEAHLLVVFELAQLENHPHVLKVLVTLVFIMQGKELAGQERALLCAGFASGVISEPLKSALDHRRSGQAHCMELFARQAPPDLLAQYHQYLASPAHAELERLRALAQKASTDGTPLPNPPVLLWFDQATIYIDHLHLLESRLGEALATACRQPGSALTPAARAHESAKPSLELIASQSSRIVAVEAELRALQQILGERHLIDRAKALLMHREKMTDHQAYRQLQRLSMESGQKMTAVARQIVSHLDTDT